MIEAGFIPVSLAGSRCGSRRQESPRLRSCARCLQRESSRSTSTGTRRWLTAFSAESWRRKFRRQSSPRPTMRSRSGTSIPAAPIHVLVIPRRTTTRLPAPTTRRLLGHLMAFAAKVAVQEGISGLGLSHGRQHRTQWRPDRGSPAPPRPWRPQNDLAAGEVAEVPRRIGLSSRSLSVWDNLRSSVSSRRYRRHEGGK